MALVWGSTWMDSDKVFAAGLPDLSRMEMAIVIEAVARHLPSWALTAITPLYQPQEPAWYFTATTPSVNLACHIGTFGTQDAVLRLVFHGVDNWESDLGEISVVRAMEGAHAGLCGVLEPPAGAQIWVRQAGSWHHGVSFAA